MKIALTCRKSDNGNKIDDYKMETLFRTSHLVMYDSVSGKVSVYALQEFERVEEGNKGPALAEYITGNIGKIDVLGTPRHKLSIDGSEDLPWKINEVAGEVNDKAKDVMESLIKKYAGEATKRHEVIE